MDRNLKLNDVEFVIFDTETTGLNPYSGDRIVEIAGVRIKGGRKISSIQALINPNRPISEAAFAVNRISADMLKDAPSAREVLPAFLDFIRGSCICSYNAGFDLDFLNNELKLSGIRISEELLVVDILKMAKRLLPSQERYALWFIAEKLGIKQEQEHRAMSDVKLTLKVFRRLMKILQNKGIDDFYNFSHLFSISKDFITNLEAQKLAQIQEAIDLRARLKIRYLSASEAKVSRREILPKEIKQEKGRRYLVANCCLRNEERNFRVDGILHFEFV